MIVQHNPLSTPTLFDPILRHRLLRIGFSGPNATGGGAAGTSLCPTAA